MTEVFVTADGRGRGLRATVAIRKGAEVIEYLGERLRGAEARAREAAYGDGDDCYMYWISPQLCIDATQTPEHPARYINHSARNANLRPKIIQRTHLVFFATRDIAAGEELLFDYGDRRPDVVAANPWLRD
jgi:histone-lysine N-methyltransferase SETD8